MTNFKPVRFHSEVIEITSDIHVRYRNSTGQLGVVLTGDISLEEIEKSTITISRSTNAEGKGNKVLI